MMERDESIRNIIGNDFNIQYSLVRKNVKNINLRIRPDGSISVSANPSVPEEHVDSFVGEKSEYIFKSLQNFKKTEEFESQPKQYISGESFAILGRNIRLKVIEGSKEQIKSDGVFLQLTVKDKNDFRRKERIVKQYLDGLCKSMFSDIVHEVYPLFKKYGVSIPQVRVREMKTRWGSCLSKKGIITLNARLLETPRNCIEYVVLHEFCHFIHPDHSKKFYAFVAMLMPDWKERKSALETLGQHSC